MNIKTLQEKLEIEARNRAHQTAYDQMNGLTYPADYVFVPKKHFEDAPDKPGHVQIWWSTLRPFVMEMIERKEYCDELDRLTRKVIDQATEDYPDNERV